MEAGLKALAHSSQKAYSNNMTKHLLYLASCMKNRFTQLTEKEIREEDTRLLRLSEQIIELNEEEAAFVNTQTQRLLRTQRREAARKRRLGIPPPPTPGNISYAVYM